MLGQQLTRDFQPAPRGGNQKFHRDQHRPLQQRKFFLHFKVVMLTRADKYRTGAAFNRRATHQFVIHPGGGVAVDKHRFTALGDQGWGRVFTAFRFVRFCPGRGFALYLHIR
ncbi:hypothetical protein [Xenorhabdus bovienii]|uniref:hypothetical protein n=1 Tax=Xenorhabdus bovienii TaxID=40576 RepID=UPI0030D713FA